MAPDSHGIGNRLNALNHSASNGFANFANQPPPSTLAAQLVDNISTPAARSSHPDETNELKRLFSVIERIKDQPDLLKTDQERIEHNHTLIYVYTRVALDGLQWDNPFIKNAKQVSEASKALNFLQVTITETPAVLKYAADDKAFLFRGQEPLWLWLLPRVLRMLGSEHCLSLTPAIERFCGFILDAMNRNTYLWDLGPHVMLFLQTTFAAIIVHLGQTHIREDDEEDNADQSFELTVAPNSTLQHSVGVVDPVSQQRCSYTISSLQQAINHVTALLHILKNSILPAETPSSSTNTSISAFASYQHHVVWLLDSVASLNQVFIHCRNAADVPVLVVVETCVDIVNAYDRNSNLEGISEMVCQQMYGVMITACSGAFEMSRQLLATADRCPGTQYTLCSALLKLARAATIFKPVARLIKGQLLRPLKTFTSDYHALGHGTDLWVSFIPRLTLGPLADSDLAVGALA
jgi:serine/threonine-protein kinase ATR